MAPTQASSKGAETSKLIQQAPKPIKYFAIIALDHGAVGKEPLEKALEQLAKSGKLANASGKELAAILVAGRHLTKERANEILAMAKKESLKCVDCGFKLNVVNYQPSKTYKCPRCGGHLGLHGRGAGSTKGGDAPDVIGDSVTSPKSRRKKGPRSGPTHIDGSKRRFADVLANTAAAWDEDPWAADDEDGWAVAGAPERGVEAGTQARKKDSAPLLSALLDEGASGWIDGDASARSKSPLQRIRDGLKTGDSLDLGAEESFDDGGPTRIGSPRARSSRPSQRSRGLPLRKDDGVVQEVKGRRFVDQSDADGFYATFTKLAREIQQQSKPGSSIIQHFLNDLKVTARYDLEEAPSTASFAGRLDPSQVADRYLFERELGRGGMGVVLVAYDQDLRRRVAMKIIRPKPGIQRTQVERFVQESQITGQLEHPNIVPVHEVGITPHGYLYFTMKYVDGLPMSDILGHIYRSDDEPMRQRILRQYPIHRRVDIVAKLCDAIGFAHSKGVIHRDLKPDNVMVGQFGEVLLMDWGLARITNPIQDAIPDVSGSFEMRRPVKPEDRVVTDKAMNMSVQTMDGHILGTPVYMSPEQATGVQSSVDHRTDVYALGAILYEACTGCQPFTADNVWDLLKMVQEGDITPPTKRDKEVPKHLEKIILKAMAKKKDDRFQSAAELADALRGFSSARRAANAGGPSVMSKLWHGITSPLLWGGLLIGAAALFGALKLLAII